MLILTIPNKEVLNIFNLTTHKEDFMHILYGQVLCRVKIENKNTYAQILTDGYEFVHVHPMQSKSQSGEDLNVLIRDI